MEQDTWTHNTVLLHEAVDALEVQRKGVFVDATFGRGGHSALVLSKLNPMGSLIAFDKDPEAVQVAQRIQDPRFSIRHEGFANLGELPTASVAGVLMDLGISSPQIDNPQRGFSFRFDGPLDMRMDPTRGEPLSAWLEYADQDKIAQVIREYGEERFAVSIAKAIVARRNEGDPIRTTRQLATLVASVVRTRDREQDPATRTFQAIRIFINQELRDLEEGLKMALRCLKPHGRLVVISFHSLEDRIVKQFMQEQSKVHVPRGLPLTEAQIPKSPMRILGRIKPSSTEITQNPRARSAVMRVAEKVALS